MTTIKKIIGIVTCCICVVLIVTLTIQQKEEPLILGKNPKEITVGEKFNEVEGQSTLGVNGRNFNKYDIIYINDIEQPTTVDEINNVATCFVSEENYDEEKKMKVQIKRVVEGQVIRKSNKVTIPINK